MSFYDEITDDNKTYIKLIEQNCGQILSVIKDTKRYLYRGMRDLHQDTVAFKSNIRPNRWPSDTRLWQHIIISRAMRKLGYKATRDNSLFAISRWTHSSFYGSVFLIFPCDGFNYTFSKSHSDGFGWTGKIANGVLSRSQEADSLMTLHSSESLTKLSDQLLEDQNILNYFNKRFDQVPLAHDTQIDYAMRHGNELMIANSQYYAFKMTPECNEMFHNYFGFVP